MFPKRQQKRQTESRPHQAASSAAFFAPPNLCPIQTLPRVELKEQHSIIVDGRVASLNVPSPLSLRLCKNERSVPWVPWQASAERILRRAFAAACGIGSGAEEGVLSHGGNVPSQAKSRELQAQSEWRGSLSGILHAPKFSASCVQMEKQPRANKRPGIGSDI